MLGANTGMLRVNNFGLAGNKPPQKFGVLIVNLFDVLGAEKALLGHAVVV